MDEGKRGRVVNSLDILFEAHHVAFRGLNIFSRRAKLFLRRGS
jgi:hypothetical protein